MGIGPPAVYGAAAKPGRMMAVGGRRAVLAGLLAVTLIAGCSGGGGEAEVGARLPDDDPFCVAARDLQAAADLPAAEGAREAAEAVASMDAHAPRGVGTDTSIVHEYLTQAEDAKGYPERSAGVAALRSPAMEPVYERLEQAVGRSCGITL